MNNKIMLLVVLMVVVIGIIGIYFWPTPTKPITPPTGLQNIILSSLVKGCAETDKGMTTKSVEGKVEQEPKIEFIGNEIRYSRSINHLCCRKAEIEKEAENSIISIYEVWTGIGCKCMCFSEIRAKLTNVPSGTYTVNVYEKGTKPGSDEIMEQELILTQNITVQ